ncbi:MAG: GGDEF domain-containing protein [Natronincolaceae bacterium]|jgi:diguanylate cyclase (GGDEF)-like protein|nr:GGDEF domain-containing protein [Clostridiales bacterium]
MSGKAIPIIIGIFIIMGVPICAEARLLLTDEERNYIAEAGVLKAVSINGAAPIQYTDTRGEIQGISKRVLEEISDMTGLIFQYKLYDSNREAYADIDHDIFFGIPYHYASNGMVLSKPFLKTETILYINSSLESNQLDDKTYAAVRGRVLPEGINEENIVYFDTREESLDAVEKGKADYGYGNTYSVIFYILQNNYRNIIAIPKKKELREYCMGVPNDNRVLLSIINKSIDAIDEGKMEALILDETLCIDRKITFSMIIDIYGKEIFGAIFLMMGILLCGVVCNVRSNKILRAQNEKNEMLSQASNEYLYEYFVKSGRLELSKKCNRLFGTQKQLRKASNILKDILLSNNLDGNIPVIKLPLANGEIGTFKSIGLSIHDEKGEPDFIVGKMIDIHDEIKEKEELIIKSKLDGPTGLYNAITTKELINESIKNRDKNRTDALIVIDCDDLKHINDTYGHLAGDQVLKNISTGMKLTFRQDDIIGRIGGDEFCIYMKGVPSINLVKLKCRQLNLLIREMNEDFYVSVSCGSALLEGENTYEELFENADKVLYKAKKRKGVQSVRDLNF